MVRRALIAIAALTVWATPGMATQDAWPALHDVADVAADDVLNLRAEPGADHAAVGALAPDAVRVEVIRATPDGRWGLVNHGEGTAWAAMRFLARRPGQWQGAPVGPLACHGTEPFWSLAIVAGEVRFETPDDARPGTVRFRRTAANRRDVEAFAFALEDGGAGVAVIGWRACDDGMSDRAFGLRLDLIVDDALMSGCCSLR